MKSQSVHHAVAILLALPVLLAAAWVAHDSPELLYPGNRNMFCGDLWKLLLPTFVCSVGIVVNGIVALRSLKKEHG